MSVLGSLSIKLGIVTQGFDTSINNSKSKINDLNSAVNTVNKTLGAFGVSLGLATAVQGIRTVINYADQVKDLSNAFDLSTSKVLQFRDALGQSGSKAENADRILGQLFDKIETAKNSMVTDDIAKQFAKLGLSIQDLKTMQPEQALTAVFNGLSKIGNTYERTALIKDLLGKSGIGLDIKNLAVLMDESSAKFDKSADSITRLAEAADKLAHAKESLMSFFTIPIAGVLDKITETGAAQIVAYQAAFTALTNKQEQAALKLSPGGFANLSTKGVGLGFDLNAESAGASAFGKGKQPIREFKLGVAAKDYLNTLEEISIEKESTANTVDLQSYINIKDQTTALKQQLELEKERFALRSDAYMLSEKEQKIAEIELNRREQINAKQEKLKELEYSTEAQAIIHAKQEQLQQEIETINQLADAEKNLANVEEERRQSFEFGWKKAFMAYAEDAKNAAQVGGDVFNSVVGNMGSALDNFVQTGKFSFKDFANSVIQDILRIMMRWQMMQIITGIMGSFGASKSPIGGSGVSATNFAGASPMAGVGFAAAGGYIDSPTIVGENGAELFIPNRPGTIIPNARMGDFMGNQPQMVVNGTYIAQMSAIDTQSAQQFLAKNRQSVYAANQSAQRGLPAGR